MIKRTKPPPLGRGEGFEGQTSLTGDDPSHNSPTALPSRTVKCDRAHVTPIFRAIIVAAERRRLSIAMPMEKLCEFAGLPDRYYPKALHSDAPSGRQARWSTMQILCDVLWPDGFDLTIVPRVGAVMTAQRKSYALRFDQQLSDARSRRQLLSEWGRKGGQKHSTKHLAKIGRRGGQARARKLSKEMQTKLARHAAEIKHRRNAEAREKLNGSADKSHLVAIRVVAKTSILGGQGP